MNGSIMVPGVSQQSSILVYAEPCSMSERSISLSTIHEIPSSSWKKFIHAILQQAGLELSMTAIPLEKATTKGPLVLKPEPLPENYDAMVDDFLRFIDSLEPQADDIVPEQ